LKQLKNKPEKKDELKHRDIQEGYLINTIKYLEAIIFSSVPDGSSFYFITPAIEKIAGVKPEQAVEKKFVLMKMVDPEDFAAVKNFFTAAKEGTAGTLEYRIKNGRGEKHFLRHSIFPIMENGKVIRIDGIIYDITKEKQNEEQLKKSDEKLSNLIEAADDLIFVLDKSGNFVSVNVNGALNLEYNPGEMKGKHFLNFIEDSNKQAIAKSFREILRVNSVVTFEAFFRSKYNKTIIFEVNARAILENSKVGGLIGIGRNVTAKRFDQEKMKDLNNKLIEANRLISIERDRAKQKVSILEELNHLKNEFVSNISHELRTPLASIIGFAETIDSDKNMPQELRDEFNQIILNEAKRLATLINDVLDISKIEEGKIDLVKNEFTFNEVITPLVEEYKRKSHEKGIVFRAEIPEQKVYLFADKNRIMQVLDNVLSNALKFTVQGRITLMVQSMYRECEIIITDTGIGIPKKDIPFLFQKFYRVSRAGSEIPGTGLGLAFVKQIIDLHKGYVTIKSEENKGSTVVIKLPTARQE
jgi:PAS domain S-box-containing protein